MVPRLTQLFTDHADEFWINLRTPWPSCQHAKPLFACNQSALCRSQVQWTRRSSHSIQRKCAAKWRLKMKQFVWMNQPAVFASTPPFHSLFAVKVKIPIGQGSTIFMQQCSLSPLVLTLTALWTMSPIRLMMNWSPNDNSPCALNPQLAESTGRNHNTNPLKLTVPSSILAQDLDWLIHQGYRHLRHECNPLNSSYLIDEEEPYFAIV